MAFQKANHLYAMFTENKITVTFQIGIAFKE